MTTAKEILEGIYTAGYHDALTNAEPKQAMGATVEAAMRRLAAAGLKVVRDHKWFRPEQIDYDCCQDCGIVRRADDRNRPCPGPVSVGLRFDRPLKDEYTEE
jgi:hypothetical protein